jgi:hypothetical protein
LVISTLLNVVTKKIGVIMAIDGFTTLTSVLQSDASATAASRSVRGSVGPYAANVAPSAAHDLDVENRAAGTFAGLVNPKKGIEPLDDEAETYPYYVEEEGEEKDEEKDIFDWDELEDEECDEDEEDDMADYLTFKQEKGMFLDIQA